MKLQKVNLTSSLSSLWCGGKLTELWRVVSLRKRLSIKICTDKIHNKDRDFENVTDKS